MKARNFRCDSSSLRYSHLFPARYYHLCEDLDITVATLKATGMTAYGSVRWAQEEDRFIGPPLIQSSRPTNPMAINGNQGFSNLAKWTPSSPKRKRDRLSATSPGRSHAKFTPAFFSWTHGQ
jgi:hypothetical protein